MDYARSELGDFIWILLGRSYPETVTTVEVYQAVLESGETVVAHYGETRTSDDVEFAWQKEVRWAHQDLCQAGWSCSVKPGFWRLTPAGHKHLVDAEVLD